MDIILETRLQTTIYSDQKNHDVTTDNLERRNEQTNKPNCQQNYEIRVELIRCDGAHTGCSETERYSEEKYTQSMSPCLCNSFRTPSQTGERRRCMNISVAVNFFLPTNPIDHENVLRSPKEKSARSRMQKRKTCMKIHLGFIIYHEMCVWVRERTAEQTQSECTHNTNSSLFILMLTAALAGRSQSC